MKRMMTLVTVLAVAFAFAGCGGKQADTSTPVEQIKAAAAKLDSQAIQKTIDTYKAAIAAKEAEFQKLADKIKAIPVAQMLGDEAKKLKASSEQLQTTIQALTERLQVYVDALKEKADAAK